MRSSKFFWLSWSKIAKGPGNRLALLTLFKLWRYSVWALRCAIKSIMFFTKYRAVAIALISAVPYLALATGTWITHSSRLRLYLPMLWLQFWTNSLPAQLEWKSCHNKSRYATNHPVQAFVVAFVRYWFLLQPIRKSAHTESINM